MASVGLPGSDLDDEQVRRGQRMPARSDAPRSSTPPSRSSSSPATTWPSWTRSPSAPGCPSRSSTSASPASSGSTSPSSTPSPTRCSGLLGTPSRRRTTTRPGSWRPSRPALEYVSRGRVAPWLIFESDLRSRPEVSSRLEGFSVACAAAMAEVISADTSLSAEDAHLLGMALTGMAQIAARDWLAQGGPVPAGGRRRGRAAGLARAGRIPQARSREGRPAAAG